MFLLISICFVFTGCQATNRVFNQSNNISKQIEAKGGFCIELIPQKEEAADISEEELSAIKIILDKRLENIGIIKKEITIDKARNIKINFLYDENLDLSDMESKINLVTKKGLFTVQEIDENSLNKNGDYLPTGKIIFEGIDIKDAHAATENNTYNLTIELYDKAAKDFEKATGKLIGKPLGIFMDDELISAPIVQAKITGGKLVIWGISKEEALDLNNIIKSGTLPMNLSIKSINKISALETK